MSICAACQKFPLNLFTSLHSEVFTLHPSLTSLLASASAGCRFCVFLWHLLGINSANVLPQPSRVRLFREAHYSDNITCQIDEPRPTDVERPRRLFTGFQFAVEPFEGRSRQITGDTRSEETFRQIEKWLDRCGTGHMKCRPASEEEFLPTRLMDLQSMNISSDASPKLILAAALPCKHVNYIALSYVRGTIVSKEANPQARQTTEENVNQHLSSGIPSAELPRTIREGIEIALRLKIRYIWDRSLCIIQDSPSDWMLESHLIPKIYAHANVTIAASAAANIHEGYFRDSEKRTEDDCALFSVSSSEGGLTTHNVFERSRFSDRVLSEVTPSNEAKNELQVLVMKSRPQWGNIFDASPLNKCAWATQEREFSPRILHFTETQVLWECHTLSFRGLAGDECAPRRVPKIPAEVARRLARN